MCGRGGGRHKRFWDGLKQELELEQFPPFKRRGVGGGHEKLYPVLRGWGGG